MTGRPFPFLFGVGEEELDAWPCPRSFEEYEERKANMRWLSENDADPWLIELVMYDFLDIKVILFWHNRGESFSDIRLRCLRFYFGRDI